MANSRMGLERVEKEWFGKILERGPFHKRTYHFKVLIGYIVKISCVPVCVCPYVHMYVHTCVCVCSPEDINCNSSLAAVCLEF